MRLIDAGQIVYSWFVEEDGTMSDGITLQSIIDRLPTIDAVPIVRCKDCKHKYIENMTWHCPFGLMGGEDFFCGYGSLGRAKRRSDDSD